MGTLDEAAEIMHRELMRPKYYEAPGYYTGRESSASRKPSRKPSALKTAARKKFLGFGTPYGNLLFKTAHLPIDVLRVGIDKLFGLGE